MCDKIVTRGMDEGSGRRRRRPERKSEPGGTEPFGENAEINASVEK